MTMSANLWSVDGDAIVALGTSGVDSVPLVLGSPHAIAANTNVSIAAESTTLSQIRGVMVPVLDRRSRHYLGHPNTPANTAGLGDMRHSGRARGHREG